MAHVVETGAGLSNANAYLSAAQGDTYFTDHGNPSDWTAAITADKEEAIRLASQYLDAVYGQRWKGSAVKSDQALDWPRAGVVSRDGWLILSDSLPQALKDATAEAALRSLQGDVLLPDLAVGSSAGLIAKSVKAGPVEVSKQWGGVTSPYKTYSLIDKLLADLKSGQFDMERG